MLGTQLDAAPARKTAPRPAAAARDWTRIVVATPELGFRMGNPAAKVKLVEYGSLTCGHCAHFSAQGDAALAAFVRRGTVSYEYRNYVLNGIDVAASLLTRCSGPAGFFPMTHRLYATQPQWLGRITGLTAAQKEALGKLPEAQRLPRLAQMGGLTQIAGSYGVTPARAARCLTDEAGMNQLNRIGETATALGVEGTPTFLLNGANIGSHTWATLEPILRESGG